MWSRKGILGLPLKTVLFLISKETVISLNYSIEVKHDVKIPQTMCAIVPCKFRADGKEKFLNATGFWKEGYYTILASTDMSEGKKKHFHAIGDPKNGDCTLKITNASKEDNGTYNFRYEESKDNIKNYDYMGKRVTVEVTDIKEVDGYSIQVDQTVTVQKGLCVTIPCTFTADHMNSFTGSKGHWKTICQEFAASNNKSIIGIKPHFQLMGNSDNGDCTLMITDAEEQDSGKYHFAFEDGKDNSRKHSYIYKMITIQVTADNTVYFVIAGVVGIAALVLVAVTLKLLLRSRTKNTEEKNKTKNRISTENQYEHQPDTLYENAEFANNADEEIKCSTEPQNLYVNFEEGPVAFEEESVYANT